MLWGFKYDSYGILFNYLLFKFYNNINKMKNKESWQLLQEKEAFVKKMHKKDKLGGENMKKVLA